MKTLPFPHSDFSHIFWPQQTTINNLHLPPNHPINEVFPISSSAHHSPFPHSHQQTQSSNSSSPSIESHSTSVASPIIHPPPHIQLRRSSRQHQPPAYLSNYHCNTGHLTNSPSIPRHWCNLVSFNQLPPQIQNGLHTISNYHEPTYFSQASKDPNWINAMQQEIQALQANNTWELTDLPPGKKAIGNKWVYKVKTKSDGSLDKFKARLVIQR